MSGVRSGPVLLNLSRLCITGCRVRRTSSPIKGMKASDKSLMVGGHESVMGHAVYLLCAATRPDSAIENWHYGIHRHKIISQDCIVLRSDALTRATLH
jgi:hypothetical protein